MVDVTARRELSSDDPNKGDTVASKPNYVVHSDHLREDDCGDGQLPSGFVRVVAGADVEPLRQALREIRDMPTGGLAILKLRAVRDRARKALADGRPRISWTPGDERIARAFHDTYERLAPSYGYETRPDSRTHWALVPADNKKLMIAVVRTLLDEGVIRA